MRFLLRKTSSSVSRSTGSWLTLTLLFVVLVPALGLLWFMNAAIENERLAVRQKLIDAYRAQLDGAQERLQAAWTSAADELQTRGGTMRPAALLASAVRDDRADALVCFDPAGNINYPDPFTAPETTPSPPGWSDARKLEQTDPAAAATAYGRLAIVSEEPNLIARSLQAQARCLDASGDRAAALALLTGSLQEDRLQHATDASGRVIAPSAALRAIEIAGAINRGQVGAIRARLQSRVLDYEHIVMPATQRRFLLRELQKLSPDAEVARLLAAEDLAASYAAATDLAPRDAALRKTILSGVWRTASSDGRVVLLHQEANLQDRLRRTLGPGGFPADVRLDFVPPGHESETALLSLPAGPELPGWRLALALADPQTFDAATSKRTTSYAWIVALIVCVALVLALLARGLVQRQVALTQLRNDLVANVTHELKTPLASMRLLVETLLNAPQLNEQTTREYLQLIATENLRLSRLIGNFLTFSRIERNKYTFDFKTVPAPVIAENAAAAVRDRLTTPDCRFDVDIAPDLPAIAVDADAMVTALVNLLDNAWKYSGEAKHIALSASACNGSVRFAVRDNGIGLSRHEAQRIFRRFYQVRPSQPTGGGGAGLGLSIVQFIVSAHRGSVDVESEPGRGSTFTIALPAAEVIR